MKYFLPVIAAGLLSLPPGLSAEPGVKVKAYGSGPDWQLEIMEKGNRINFTLDGQAGSYSYGKLGPTLYRDRKTHVYRVLDDVHAMTVFVKSNACIDSVTGKSHEVTVIIAFDGEGYGGCGDVLTHLLEP
jgi:uncharacterized membrane protein